MANEIQVSFQAGRTVYFLIRNAAGQVWNGSTFETYATANYTTYDVAGSEQGTASAFYVGTFPATIAAGKYAVVAKSQVGAAPAEGDPTVGYGDVYWDGSAEVALSNLATSGQVGQFAPIRFARGHMIQNFGFYLRSTSDHVTPILSGVCSGQMQRDNGTSWGALQSGAFTNHGNGFYSVQALTSGDLLCNTARLLFTANDASGGAADPVPLTLYTQKTSGAA